MAEGTQVEGDMAREEGWTCFPAKGALHTAFNGAADTRGGGTRGTKSSTEKLFWRVSHGNKIGRAHV